MKGEGSDRLAHVIPGDILGASPRDGPSRSFLDLIRGAKQLRLHFSLSGRRGGALFTQGPG